LALTVGEAFRLNGVRQLILDAGEAGLDREIRHVTVIEVPEAVMWKGKEFLITAFVNVRGDLESQLVLMDKAARRDCAALAILQHPEGAYSGELPDALRKRADNLALPLFRIPNHVPYIDIIFPIYREIVNHQARELEYALEAHNQMTQVVFAGKELSELVGLVARLVDNPVAVLNRWGRFLAGAAPGRSPSPAELKRRAERAHPAVTLEHFPPGSRRTEESLPLPSGGGPPGTVVRCPIRAGRARYGHIIVWVENIPLTQLHLMALEQASTVLAFCMEKERVVQEVKAHMQRDLLDELLGGADSEELEERLRALGWTLEDKRAVMMIRLERPRPQADTGRPHVDDEGAEDDFYVLQCALASDCPDHIGVRRGTSLVILVRCPPGASDDDVRDACDRLARVLLKAFASRRTTLAVGIGNPCASPDDFRRSYAEARNALALGRRVNPAGSVFHIDRLAGYYHLSRLSRRSDLCQLVDRTLGPLLAYDEENHTDLTRTLEAMVACGGNASDAARELFVHRNTLKHRLEKIQEILGFDPLESPDRLSVHMALAARTLLRRRTSG